MIDRKREGQKTDKKADRKEERRERWGKTKKVKKRDGKGKNEERK